VQEEREGQDGVGSQTKDTRRRRALIVVVLSVLAVIVLVFVLPVLLVNSSVVASQVRERLLPRISAQLGRQVSIKDFEVSLFPRPSVHLQELRIGGTGGGLPLLEAPSASFTLRLWPLLFSRGRNVQVHSVELQNPVVNLVRAPDGTWSYEDLLSGEADRQLVVSSLRVGNGTLRIVDQSGPGRQVGVALTKLDGVATDLGSGQPFTISLAAALASARQNVALSLERQPEGVLGNLEIRSVAIGALAGLMPAGLNNLVRDGTLSLDAEIFPPQDGGYAARGSAQLEDLALREGQARSSFDFLATSTPQAPGVTVELEEIRFDGPGTKLGGRASFSTAPLQGDFDLQGEQLALDVILGALPAPTEKAENLLPEPTRRRLERATLRGALALGRVTSGRLLATDVAARVNLREGVFSVQRASAQLYGGALNVGAASIDLREALPPWQLDTRLEGMDLGRALSETTGAAPVTGVLGATLNLSGRGNDWQRLRESMTGEGTMTLLKGTLQGYDMRSVFAEPLARALEIIGQGFGGAGAAGQPGATPLENLELSFVLRNGAMRLISPLTFNSDFGSARFSGTIGLDWRLDLTGEIFFAPEFVREISGDRVAPRSPVEVPASVTGTLREPALQISAQAIAQEIASGRLRRGLRDKADGLLRRFGGSGNDRQ
jgi:uncharacterized protein involved in outer membrane biogenesis